jgi:hypothetical protein
MRLFPLLAAVLVATLPLVGCGKAGRPQQPPDSVYPRIYPDPAQVLPSTVEPKTGKAPPPEWDQQDLKDRFTSSGSYIDPSTKAVPASQITPGTTLPNTRTTSNPDLFNQSMGSSSVLPPVQPTSPADVEDQQQ